MWRKDVEQYVWNCTKCQWAKNPWDKTPGQLQLLPIPEWPWQHISMDFQSFPKDKKGHDAAFVVVDWFSKRLISIPCYKTTDAARMAQLFMEHVYQYQGALTIIVSDRGPQFISDFWNKFCKILGIQLKLSTAHHAQTDGQTEIVNQHIATQIQPFINHHQDNWSELLPMVDFATAALPSDTTLTSPFFIDCGYEPQTSFNWHLIDNTLPWDRWVS